MRKLPKTRFDEQIDALRLMDDDFMRLFFDNNFEATELLLNVFFDRYDMKVIKMVPQLEAKNPNGRSVRFDIYAVDSEDKHYDIEIQRCDYGADEKRARLYSSALDSRLLSPGQSVGELPESYVIFITESDVRGEGRAIYRFSRMDEDTHKLFSDGSHIIYVNAAYVGDDRVGQLMHDFRCTSGGEMKNDVLADRMNYFKETEGGRGSMCRIFEDVRNDGKAEGKAEGRIEGRIEGKAEGKAEERLKNQLLLIPKFLKRGDSFEEIAAFLEITVDEVMRISKLVKA